ncbi:hypothetical protein HAX54_007620, partial [Datura stramonium]|nr:hypothetical protein [Datura stramonium]
QLMMHKDIPQPKAVAQTMSLLILLAYAEHAMHHKPRKRDQHIMDNIKEQLVKHRHNNFLYPSMFLETRVVGKIPGDG